MVFISSASPLPDPAPADSPPPFYDPLLPNPVLDSSKNVGVAIIIEYVTYVLCGLAATIVVATISAGGENLDFSKLRGPKFQLSSRRCM